MMTTQDSDWNKAIDGIACPETGSKLVLTKENILFSQKSCMGYPLLGEVPDFRDENKINFKELARQRKQGGVPAKLEILSKLNVQKEHELPVGHCLLVGRAIYLEPDTDITFVGVPQESRIVINQKTRLLIEKFLADPSLKTHSFVNQALEDMPLHPNQYLGHFKRDQDVMLDHKSVSRAHAIFYHADDGLWLLDLVSKNGTFVNGREIERIKLRHNDAVSLGRIHFRVGLR